MSLSCTDHLIQEHRLILRSVYVLEAMADQAREGRMPADEDVDKLVDFLKRFADDHHQGKEEAVLFPCLRETSDGPNNALRMMMFEHEQERSLVVGLEDALRTRKNEDFAYYGARLSEILSTHIYKEDNILFSLVERTISKEVDARVVREMTAYDESLPAATREEMNRVVNDLEWKYLGKAA
jgi:hemerythrin-like domain-containing protein